INNTAKASGELVDRLMELSDKEKKSATDKLEMSRIAEELNGRIDGLALAYDGATDSLNLGEDALRKRIQLMKDEQTLASGQNRLIEIMEERNKVESKIEGLNELREKALDLEGLNRSEKKKSKKAAEELGEEIDNLKNSEFLLGKEFENVSFEIAEAQDKVNRAIIEGVRTQTLSYEQLSEDQKKIIDNLASMHEKYSNDIINSFEKIPKEAEHSFDELKAILRHNLEA